MPTGLLSLPPEIIDDILSRLEPCDILHAHRTSKQLRNAVESSSLLQYILECYKYAVVDELRPGLSFAERLDLLRRRESSWRSLQPLAHYDIRVPFKPNGLYDFTGGIFILGVGNREEGNYACLRLPSAGDESPPKWSFFKAGQDLVDFGLSVDEHDLIVVATAKTDGMFDGGAVSLSCDLQFRTLSGGVPHPQAKKFTVNLYRGGQHLTRPSALIEIVGDYVAVLLVFPFAFLPDRLYLVEWKTGVVHLINTFKARTYHGLVWLSKDCIMLPNDGANALDIFRISDPDDSDMLKVIMACRLQLPPLKTGIQIVSSQCRAEPNPSVTASGLGRYDRPFYHPPESAVVFLTMRFTLGHQSVSLSIITHRHSLLAFVPSEAEVRLPLIIPYEQWGVKCTCWFPHGSNWITTTAGQRYSYIVTSWPEREELADSDDEDEDNMFNASQQLYVLDFNPLRVQAALVTEDGPDRETVVHGPRRIPYSDKLFVEGRHEFKLPYIMSSTWKLPKHGGYLDAWLDEERVMTIKTNTAFHDVTGADLFIFG